jgi:hypothetical protein
MLTSAIPYEYARNNIKDGDLLLFSGNHIISKLIKFFTGSDISHAAIAMWHRTEGETEDQLWVIESTLTGIRLVNLSTAIGEKPYSRVYWLHMKQSSGVVCEAVVNKALSMVGGRYPGYYQLFVLAFGLIRTLRMWRTGTADVDPDAYHCAEYVALCLQSGGLVLTKDPYLYTPYDLMNLNIWHPVRYEIIIQRSD